MDPLPRDSGRFVEEWDHSAAPLFNLNLVAEKQFDMLKHMHKVL